MDDEIHYFGCKVYIACLLFLNMKYACAHEGKLEIFNLITYMPKEEKKLNLQ
jgi:hypothetical protein